MKPHDLGHFELLSLSPFSLKISLNKFATTHLPQKSFYKAKNIWVITLFQSSKNIQEGDTSDSTERVSVVEEINYSEVTCS